MPTTLVWIKGSGESMERSTWDSAAGAVDGGRGREIHDGVDVMFGEETGDEGGIADIAVRENVARVVREVGEVSGVAGVGERVEVDELGQRGAFFSEALTDEVAANKAGAAGDEEVHEFSCGCRSMTATRISRTAWSSR